MWLTCGLTRQGSAICWVKRRTWVKCPNLLVAQGDHRVNARRAARRHVAGDQRNCAQYRGCCQENHRVAEQCDTHGLEIVLVDNVGLAVDRISLVGGIGSRAPDSAPIGAVNTRPRPGLREKNCSSDHLQMDVARATPHMPLMGAYARGSEKFTKHTTRPKQNPD